METHTITSAKQASTLLQHPLRLRIMAAARVPVSAAQLARDLGETRQRLNYHVRALARHGLLEPAGQQRKRNMVEQQYVASASGYLLAPALLGDLVSQAGEAHESGSAAQLASLFARAHSDVAAVVDAATQAGLRVRTTALDRALHFENAQQRAQFADELSAAIEDLIDEYTPDAKTAGASRPFRLVLGLYPVV